MAEPDPRPISSYELAVVAVLRSESWRWFSVREVHEAAPAFAGRGVKRRVIRHHVERLRDLGVIDEGHGFFYRWSEHPPASYVERIETAAKALRFALPPVSPRPTHCPRGHPYADGVIDPLGRAYCAGCGEVAFFPEGWAIPDPDHRLRYGARRRPQQAPSDSDQDKDSGGDVQPDQGHGDTSETPPSRVTAHD